MEIVRLLVIVKLLKILRSGKACSPAADIKALYDD